jgi:hypothetical protein
MKYRTVEISPWKTGWHATDGPVDGDRVQSEGVPNPLGFYHYPETETLKAALAKLRDCMITAHIKEITRLQISIRALRKVKWK